MNFAVYTKDGCPYCDKVKQVLELTGSKFVVYNLDQHFDRKSFYGELIEEYQITQDYNIPLAKTLDEVPVIRSRYFNIIRQELLNCQKRQMDMNNG